MRRNQFPASVRPAFVSGLALLIVGAVGRVLGGAMYFEWLNTASLLPVVAGLVLAFGGWSVLRWSLPAVAFLIFMIPMPYSIEITLGFPLQTAATAARYAGAATSAPISPRRRLLHSKSSSVSDRSATVSQ